MTKEEAPRPPAPDWYVHLDRDSAYYQEERARRIAEDWERIARRLLPVCGNCQRAGPWSGTGNAPYSNDRASCMKRAPVATGTLEHDSNAYRHDVHAFWPTVHFFSTCGDFALVPLKPEDMSKLTTYRTDLKWAFQKDETP